jgi:hypothetical protein
VRDNTRVNSEVTFPERKGDRLLSLAVRSSVIPWPGRNQ